MDIKKIQEIIFNETILDNKESLRLAKLIANKLVVQPERLSEEDTCNNCTASICITPCPGDSRVKK